MPDDTDMILCIGGPRAGERAPLRSGPYFKCAEFVSQGFYPYPKYKEHWYYLERLQFDTVTLWVYRHHSIENCYAAFSELLAFYEQNIKRHNQVRKVRR